MLGMVQYEDEQDEWSGDRSKLPNTKEAAIRIIQSLDPSCDLVGVASFCGPLYSASAVDDRSRQLCRRDQLD